MFNYLHWKILLICLFQVMQFGRIDHNAYTLDFQYPFSAVQAFAVALANVTQRLKWNQKYMHSGRVAYFQESLVDLKSHATPLTIIAHMHCQEDFRKTGLELWVLSIFKFSRKKKTNHNYTTRCFIVYVDQRAVKQSWLKCELKTLVPGAETIPLRIAMK